ncbi:MAG: PAS domain-containing protein, partial [Lachnospiraceae bacterium]|nr:PAS domain-containing protein [Lachnospiraceae bacterium]
MGITREDMGKLVQMIPGGSIAYLVENGRLRLADCSTNVATAIGYTRDEFFSVGGDDPYRMIYGMDVSVMRQQVEACLSREHEMECSVRVINKNGEPLWVHFRGCMLGEMEGKQVLLATVHNISSTVNRTELINLVPTGMGIYTLKNGVVFQSFLNDGYYDMLGIRREDRTAYRNENTINAVHPGDRERLLAIVQEAVAGEGAARTTVRMMLNDESDYLWVQLDGRIVERRGDICIFYVSFTNIDELKRISNALEKNKMTLEASLAAGQQMCCEYDPRLHTLVGKTGNHVKFGQPNTVENFPDSLIESHIFAPEDGPVILKKVRELDQGAETTQFDARIRFLGKMHWFRFCFKKYLDAEKGYEVAICNFMDISAQKELLLSCQNHLDTVMRLNPDAIATFRMNVTKDICGTGSSAYWNILKLQDKGTVTDFFREGLALVRDEQEKVVFERTFARPSILREFEMGNRRIHLEHQYELEDGYSEWIRTSLELVKNPETNDVEGVLYTENINREKIETMILTEIMHKDYRQIVVQFANQAEDEYYVFDNMSGEYCVRHKNLWKNGLDLAKRFIETDDVDKTNEKFSMERVKKALEEQDEYALTFQLKGDPEHRYRVKYKYMNREEKILMITTRDITDATLLEKFRYELDHDPLTDLYNLQKTYRECDKLLAQHEDKEFAIVRLDIQRFRLYNSFYGEEEGDRLLCYIADMLRGLSKSHEYGVYGRSHADVFLLCFPMRDGVLGWNREYIHNYLQEYRNDFYLAAFGGIYISKGPHESAQVLFNRAILAAKSMDNKQMNRVSFYEPGIEKELQREQQIIREMKSALQEEQFKVYIQPKYNVKTGQPVGGEALVRWDHPEYGIIAPGMFIPIFEKNGFIMELDRYMWEHVCMLLHRWIEEGRDPAPIS